MGVENNECVVATTWNNENVENIRGWVQELPPEYQQLFGFLPSLKNNKTTIFLAPDGSKKGWGTAEKVALLRDAFIEKLESFNHSDGSNPFDYIEVGYGEYGQKVLRGNCKNCYDNSEYAGE